MAMKFPVCNTCGRSMSYCICRPAESAPAPAQNDEEGFSEIDVVL